MVIKYYFKACSVQKKTKGKFPFFDQNHGLTHEFGPKLEILHLFVLDILGLEIMSDDHLVKNQALVDDKKIDFK